MSDTFDPEYVDAYELGMKNMLMDGGLTLNLTGFYYDYTGYQVSQIRDRTAVNEDMRRRCRLRGAHTEHAIAKA